MGAPDGCVTPLMPGKYGGRLVSLTTATEGHNNFFRLVAVKHEVVGLSPVLCVVELRASRALIGCWDDDVCIACILAQMHSSFPGVAALRSEAL